MRVVPIVVLLLLIFNGCANSSLTVSAKSICASSCEIKIDLKEVSRSFHSGPLHLNRYIFSDPKGNLLVKERGRLDNSLMFIVGPISLMYAGFEFQEYSSHSLDNYHDLIEGIARDGTKIYLLVQTLDEGFSIIYSKNPNLIYPLASCLKRAKLSPLDNYSKISSNENLEEAIKSDWSTKMFINHHVAVSKNYDEFR